MCASLTLVKDYAFAFDKILNKDTVVKGKATDK